MKHLPVFTVILTSVVLLAVITLRDDSKSTVKQEFKQTTYGIPHMVIESESGDFLRVQKNGNTYNIK